MNDNKLCKKCKIEKSLESFHKNKNSKDGLYSQCKLCRGCKPKETFFNTCGLRRCNKCLEIKIEDENFCFRDKNKGLRVTICKQCQKITSDQWYQNNKERHNATGRPTRRKWGIKKRDENKKMVEDLKRNPCTDCKTQYNPWVMHFDHLDGFSKKFNVGAMAHNCASKEVILLEISKCELVCANCHAERTYKRRTNNGIL